MSQLTMKAGQKDTHQGEVSVTRENLRLMASHFIVSIIINSFCVLVVILSFPPDFDCHHQLYYYVESSETEEA